MKQLEKFSSFKKNVTGKPGNGTSGFVKYSGIGVQLVAVILVFLFAGIWLDDKFGTKFLFTLVLTMVGFFGGFYSFYLNMKNLSKTEKDRKDE